MFSRQCVPAGLAYEHPAGEKGAANFYHLLQYLDVTPSFNMKYPRYRVPNLTDPVLTALVSKNSQAVFTLGGRDDFFGVWFSNFGGANRDPSCRVLGSRFQHQQLEPNVPTNADLQLSEMMGQENGKERCGKRIKSFCSKVLRTSPIGSTLLGSQNGRKRTSHVAG